MMIKASFLARAVEAVALEQPDTTAPACVYFLDNEPCCVVGHGMARLKVDPSPFSIDDELNTQTPVDELREWDVLEEDSSSAMVFLRDMQRYQDAGFSFGESYDKSKAHPVG